MNPKYLTILQEEFIDSNVIHQLTLQTRKPNPKEIKGLNKGHPTGKTKVKDG